MTILVSKEWQTNACYSCGRYTNLGTNFKISFSFDGSDRLSIIFSKSVRKRAKQRCERRRRETQEARVVVAREENINLSFFALTVSLCHFLFSRVSFRVLFLWHGVDQTTN